MSNSVTCRHVDTCRASFLIDHHNRPGELLIGIYVSSSTRNYQVRASLECNFDVTPEDGFSREDFNSAIEACFKGAHPLRVFDRNAQSPVTDDLGEETQAWFLFTWPVADGDDFDAQGIECAAYGEGPHHTPLASAEQQATPCQQQQANAGAVLLPPVAGDVLMTPGPASAYPAAAHAVRRAFNGKRNFLTPDLIGFQVAGPWAVEVSRGNGFRNRDGSAGPDLIACTVVSLETFEAVHALSTVVADRNAAALYIGRLADLAGYRRRRAALAKRLNDAYDDAESSASFSAIRRETLTAYAALRADSAPTLCRFGAEPIDTTAKRARPGLVSLGDAVHAATAREPASAADYSHCTQATPCQQSQSAAGAYPLEPIVAIVASCGFDVYMRKLSDMWLYFVDGNNIGYLENGSLRAIRVSTVHVPNTKSGSGFNMHEDLSCADLTRDVLLSAFVTAPNWASSKDIASVKKWNSFEHFKNSSRFDDHYTLVAPRRQAGGSLSQPTPCQQPQAQHGANAYRGAPLGKPSDELADFDTSWRIQLHRIGIDASGYDKSGVYWGLGKPLYCAADQHGRTAFFRAVDRDAAKAVVRAGVSGEPRFYL